MSLELPRILRPQLHPGETGPSYVARLGRRLSIPFGYLRTTLPKGSASVASKGESGQFRLVERLCSLPDGVLADVEEPPDSVLGPRLLCPDCAGGERVELHPHANSYCCSEHSRWTGPRADPTSPAWRDALPVVSEAIVQADLEFRRLSGAPHVDVDLVRQVLWTFAPEPLGQRPRVPSPERHPDVVRFIRLVTTPSFQQVLHDSTASDAEKRSRLGPDIGAALPEPGLVVGESLWRLLLRPPGRVGNARVPRTRGGAPLDDVDYGSARAGHTVSPPRQSVTLIAVAARQAGLELETDTHRDIGDTEGRGEHRPAVNGQRDLICTLGHRHQCSDASTNTPLHSVDVECPYYSEATQPKARSMAETQPLLAREWHPTLNGETTPFDVASSGNLQAYWWACMSGHEWRATPNNRARGRGCPYCTGRYVTAWTSLAAVRPDVASYWAEDGNGTLRPDDVLPGSDVTVWWVCSIGHRYDGSVRARTAGSGCRVCANLEVLPGYNDLATTHPDIAEQWDRQRNGSLGPDGVVAGSPTERHWVCPLGHLYAASPSGRTNGRGCSLCSNQRVVLGVNDLGTTHPEVAASWVPYPGELSPQQVVAGSTHRLHWRCSVGHVYPKRVLKRIAAPKCPVCINRLVLPGYNDLRTRYPEIARDWHPDKNGDDRPELLLPGNRLRWWKCRAGHEQHGNVPNRISTGGCTLCPVEDRIATPRSTRTGDSSGRLGGTTGVV